MTPSRGETDKNKMVPFLGRYKEVYITYDNSTLGVEADGLLPDGFWENIHVQYDVNSPQDYAHGLFDAYSRLFPRLHITMAPNALVLEEGYHLGDPD